MNKYKISAHCGKNFGLISISWLSICKNIKKDHNSYGTFFKHYSLLFIIFLTPEKSENLYHYFIGAENEMSGSRNGIKRLTDHSDPWNIYIIRKGYFLMTFLLIFNLIKNFRNLVFTNWEYTITYLPGDLFFYFLIVFQIIRTSSFDLFYYLAYS